METGTFATISQEQILSSVKMQLKITNTDDDIYFTKLINDGVRAINCLSIYKTQNDCFDICDGKVKLPNGLYELLAFRGGDLQGTCNYGIYTNQAFLKNCGCGHLDYADGIGYRHYTTTAEIVNGYLIFHEIPNFEVVKLAWMGLNVDKSGMFVIYEQYERALVSYVCWWKRLMDENLPMAQTYQRDWINQRNKIVSEDVLRQFRMTKHQIAEFMNAWIATKNFIM